MPGSSQSSQTRSPPAHGNRARTASSMNFLGQIGGMEIIRARSSHYPTSCPRMATGLVGMESPAAAHPPVSKIAPVPATYTVFATSTKQEAPKLDLLTAPLNVTFECGRSTSPDPPKGVVMVVSPRSFTSPYIMAVAPRASMPVHKLREGTAGSCG